MGLDWNPMPKAKPGHEAEFAQLLPLILAEDKDAGDDEHLDDEDIEDEDVDGEDDEADDGESSELVERFHAITQPVFETLGAPRVGIDPDADAWLVENVKPEHLDEAREQMQGYCVLDLLPECDGFPVYSNYPLGMEGLDRYSFRGKFLDDVEDVIGEELYARAFEKQTAADLESYGQALLAKGRAYAKQHGVEHVESVREPAFEDDSHEARAHILFAAGKWCVYWGSRGHGLLPWF